MRFASLVLVTVSGESSFLFSELVSDGPASSWVLSGLTRAIACETSVSADTSWESCLKCGADEAAVFDEAPEPPAATDTMGATIEVLAVAA